MRRETSAAPSKQHDSHCTTANRLCQGGRTIFVWFDLCPVSHSAEARSSLVLKAPFVRKRRNASPLLSLWPSKAWPAHASSLAHRRSALAPRPQSPFREEATQCFAASSAMAVKTMACPCVQSRTWQERPRPSSSKRLSRGYDAELRGSFVMAVKSMACPFVQSRTWQKRPRPSSSKPLSRGYDAELRRFFRYGRQKHGLPIRPVSHLAGAPSPLVLKAPFKRKRRKASPRPPQKTRNH